MYLMSTDLYECDFCGLQLKWDQKDERKGSIWECEKCGKHFCQQCFIDKHGNNIWQQNLEGALSGPDETSLLLCPSCYAQKINTITVKEK